MTARKKLKRAARERARKTGEGYSIARLQITNGIPAPTPPAQEAPPSAAPADAIVSADSNPFVVDIEDDSAAGDNRATKISGKGLASQALSKLDAAISKSNSAAADVLAKMRGDSAEDMASFLDGIVVAKIADDGSIRSVGPVPPEMEQRLLAPEIQLAAQMAQEQRTFATDDTVASMFDDTAAASLLNSGPFQYLEMLERLRGPLEMAERVRTAAPMLEMAERVRTAAPMLEMAERVRAAAPMLEMAERVRTAAPMLEMAERVRRAR